MTRFARAKGSKASNERIPEPATPWHEMKQQLLEMQQENKNKRAQDEANERRTANYNAFLEEHEQKIDADTKWADFPGVKKPETKEKEKEAKKKLKKAAEKFLQENGDVQSKDQCSTANASKEDETVAKIVGVNDLERKAKKKRKRTETSVEEIGVDSSENLVAEAKKAKKKLTKVKSEVEDESTLQAKELDDTKVNGQKKSTEQKKKRKKKKPEPKDGTVATKSLVNGAKKSAKGKKVKENVAPKPKKSVEEMTEEERAKFEKKKQRRVAQIEKKKKFKELSKTNDTQQVNTTNNSNNNNGYDEEKRTIQKPKQQVKPTKRIAEEDYKRRKPKRSEDTVNINGEEVALAYFDGFPIKKTDYDRLIKLQRDMRAKGIPNSEIRRALKLERRRAEKELARDKKKLCFNCRQSGHNLSECPKLGEAETQQQEFGTGICFKCGSTEHTHLQCRSVKGENYGFAQCFICRERGHIAKQCPDNSRGLYPDGGACRVCGDVTHLKKDCPKYQMQQEKGAVVAETMDYGRNVEDLGADDRKVRAFGVEKRVNKIIKFPD